MAQQNIGTETLASAFPKVQANFDEIYKNNVAYIRDEKPSGTVGGSSLATTHNVRDLNVLDDPDGIVTSLVSNQFILPAGTYEIYASSPAVSANRSRGRLYNVTDGATEVLGITAYAASGAVAVSLAITVGTFTIIAPKTFELQHYTESAFASQGLGVAATSGDVEIYAFIKLTKILE